MPRRVPRRVLVEHVSTGVRKEVLRAQWLRGLGPHWKRVTKKRPPEESAEPSHAPVEPADVPEANTKE